MRAAHKTLPADSLIKSALKLHNTKTISKQYLDLGDLQPSNVIMGDFHDLLDQDPTDDKEAARKAYVDAEVATEKARAEAAEAAIQADVDQNEARP